MCAAARKVQLAQRCEQLCLSEVEQAVREVRECLARLTTGIQCSVSVAGGGGATAAARSGGAAV